MLSYRTRRRLSLLILLVGLPLYIVAAVTFAGWLTDRYGRLPILAEVAVYVALGVLWVLPFRPIFRGIGKEDPDREDRDADGPDQRP